MGNLLKILFSHTTYGKPGGLYFDGPLIFVLSALLATFGFFVYSLVWVYRDAEKRGKSPFVAVLFILLTGWPGSFIWWFWIRPPLKKEFAEALVHLPPLPMSSQSHI